MRHGFTFARRALALGGLALAGCGTAPPPPTPAPAAKATAVPIVSAVPPRLGLLGAAPAPVTEPPDEELPEPTAPVPGRFERVPLPAGVPAITGVSGRGDRDVWMVAKDSGVLRWDGARVERKGAPRCFADACCGRLVDCARAPGKCSTKGCPFGDPSCANPVDFDSIRVTGEAVVVSAFIDTGGLTQSRIDARLDARGRWSCEQGDGDGLLHGGSQDITLDDHVIHLDTPTHFINSPGTFSVVVDGRRLPMPSDGFLFTPIGGIAARTADDLWFWAGSSVWRGDGLGWTKQSMDFARVSALWVTDPGRLVWALDEGDDLLVRWDPDRGVRARMSVPGASELLVGEGSSFWLTGKEILRHWDGRAMTSVEAPLDETARRSWLAPTGELWVVGADRVAKVKVGKSEAPAGAAHRFVPAKAVKP